MTRYGYSLIGFSILVQVIAQDAYPTCGECWCIPSSGGLGPCPLWQPQNNFSSTVIELYESQNAILSYSLYCNPYEDSLCTTTPAQEMIENEDSVCAFVYPEDVCGEYNLKTFASRIEAELVGAIVTHTGSCGLCSTTKDLAIYLTQDFTQAGKICATKGLLNEQKGLECYMDIGLTQECAKIWNYDGIYDGKVCGATCAGDITSPNNGPPPTCELNSCLQCDEEKAGPIFAAFAGRTRRRSGLQSEIVRDCSSVARILAHNPCTNTACNCTA